MGYKITASITETSYNYANNTSTVKITVKVKSLYSEFANAGRKLVVEWGLNNGTHYTDTVYRSYKKNVTTTIYSETKTIKKWSDGEGHGYVKATFHGVSKTRSDTDTCALTTTPRYTVTYKLNKPDGTVTNFKSVGPSLYGTSLANSPYNYVPTAQTGYTSDYWYEGSNKIVWPLKLTANHTIYAKYIANKYKVNVYDGDSVTTLGNTYQYKNLVTLSSLIAGGLPANPTKDGYDFGGYQYGTQVLKNSSDSFVMPASDISISYIWTPKTLNFKFYKIVDSSKVTVPEITPEEEYLTYDPTFSIKFENVGNINQYKYRGWSLTPNDNSLTYAGETCPVQLLPTSVPMPTQDTSYYAIYKLDKSSLEFSQVSSERVVISGDATDIKSWVTNSKFRSDASSTDSLFKFTINNVDVDTYATVITLVVGDVAVQLPVSSSTEVTSVEIDGVTYRLYASNNTYYIHFPNTPKEGVSYTISLTDNKYATNSVKGSLSYAVILWDFNDDGDVIRWGAVAPEKKIWESSTASKPEKQLGQVVFDWNIQLNDDAYVVDDDVEESYVQLIINSIDILSVAEGGTGRSTLSKEEFFDDVRTAVSNDLSASQVSNEWITNESNFD